MGDDAMTSLRLPAELLERADRLAEGGLGTGARVSRAVVLRRALELGLDTLGGGAAPDTLRAELSELRSRVERLERPLANGNARGLGAVVVATAERLLAELSGDGITEAPLTDAAPLGMAVVPLRVSGGLSPEEWALLSALDAAAREARSEDGLGQAAARRLREALAAVRA